MEFDPSTLIWVASTIFATLVGGFFSWWSSHSVEIKRLQREEAKRFEAERRLAYAKLLRLATQLSNLKTTDKKIAPELELEFTNVVSEIEILSSPETREHALIFSRAVHEQILNPAGEQLAAEDWSVHRKELIAAIHKELGIDTPIERKREASDIEFPALNGVTESWSNLSAQFQIPLPVATGGIGLILAFATSGGLSGGQGFLIGFAVGLTMLGYIALHANRPKAK